MGCNASVHSSAESASTPSSTRSWHVDTSLHKSALFKAKEKAQCKFEGGVSCRKEDPGAQSGKAAITGLHSSWVGPQILAMARPWQSNLQIAVTELSRLDFGMVINLQETGEHACCGPGILPQTGFSYDPATLQEHQIGYYHLAWPDMNVPDLSHVLKIVQVMHKVTHCDKKKVAVHCHAGLGRTGLVIACYLVFSLGYTAPHAVLEVRKCRYGALQTRAQEAFVLIFCQWIQHLRCCIPPAGCCSCSKTLKLWDEKLRICNVRAVLSKGWKHRPIPPSTLDEMVERQKLIMHGHMVQHYWNVPELLLNLLMGICHKLHVLAVEVMDDMRLADALACVRARLMLPEGPEEASDLATLRVSRRRSPLSGTEGAGRGASGEMLRRIAHMVHFTAGHHTHLGKKICAGACPRLSGMPGLWAENCHCHAAEDTEHCSDFHALATKRDTNFETIGPAAKEWSSYVSDPRIEQIVRELVQILPAQDGFLQTTVANLLLALHKFVLIPCMQPYFGRELVEDVTGIRQLTDIAHPDAMSVAHKASVFQSLCENVRALPQPQQDVLHAVMMVFGPVLDSHHCAPAKLIKAWLCTLLCRI